MLNYKTKKDRHKRAIVFIRDLFRCKLCDFEIERKPIMYVGDTTFIENGRWLEIDHITPIAKGGNDEVENLQTLCNVCNCKKGAR